MVSDEEQLFVNEVEENECGTFFLTLDVFDTINWGCCIDGLDVGGDGRGCDDDDGNDDDCCCCCF